MLTLDVTVWRIYIIAALTASMNVAMNASVRHELLVHGFSSVSPFVAIKGRGEVLSRSIEV